MSLSHSRGDSQLLDLWLLALRQDFGMACVSLCFVHMFACATFQDTFNARLPMFSSDTFSDGRDHGSRCISSLLPVSINEPVLRLYQRVRVIQC